MKVILLEDVRSHGKKGDVIEVSDGYARNVLIKKKQGIEATPKALNDLKLQREHKAKIDEENLQEAKALAKEMENWKINAAVKAGEGGKIFGSVSSKEIAKACMEQYGREVDKKKIILDEPIKSLGEHEVKIRLHTDVTAVIKVWVEQE